MSFIIKEMCNKFSGQRLLKRCLFASILIDCILRPQFVGDKRNAAQINRKIAGGAFLHKRNYHSWYSE